MLSYNNRSRSMEFEQHLVSSINFKHNASVISHLEQYRYLYTFVEGSGQSLLHLSAKCGNAEITRYLIQCGCKVNAQDKFGITPLMLAVDSKDVGTIDILLKHNADMYQTDHTGKSSALRRVIKAGYSFLESLRPDFFRSSKCYNILTLFFSRVKMEFELDKELTVERLQAAYCPLAFILFMNDASVTEYFLDMGYPLNELIRNWSTLHIAVLLTDVENVKVLLDYGADVNDLDNQRQTPLFLYDKNAKNSSDQLEILKILCQHGAKLDIPRYDGVTLLEYFFKNCNKDTLLAVIECGTEELKKPTAKGQSPLHFLIDNRNKCVEEILEHLLSKTNIDIDACDSEGKTVLIHAVNRGLVSKIKLLAKYGAKVDLIDILDKSNLFAELTNPGGYQARYAKIVDLLVHRGNSSMNTTESQADDTKLHTDKTFGLAKLMLKHLVLDEASVRCVNETIFMKIESKPELQEYYKTCKSQMSKMKETSVYGFVTLYRLLSDSEEKITLYARNPEFVKKFEKFMENKSRNNFHYFDFLRKRLDSAIETATLRLKASQLIWKVCRLYPDPNHDVYYKIAKCMTNRELQNLLKL